MGEPSTISLDALAQQAVISVEQAGRLLGLSPNSAYAAVHRGEIPALHLGARLVVPVPALVLRLLGTEPARLLGELGIRDLRGVLEFIMGSGEDGAGGSALPGNPLAGRGNYLEIEEDA